MIADERESLIITKIAGKPLAIIIKLPIVAMVQKGVLGLIA
jgi:hypothetical protein